MQLLFFLVYGATLQSWTSSILQNLVHTSSSKKVQTADYGCESSQLPKCCLSFGPSVLCTVLYEVYFLQVSNANKLIFSFLFLSPIKQHKFLVRYFLWNGVSIKTNPPIIRSRTHKPYCALCTRVWMGIYECSVIQFYLRKNQEINLGGATGA